MNTSPWDILSARITRVTDSVNLLPRLRQATLYSVAPLQVIFDTDTEPTLAYATLVRNMTPGDRVLVANVGHYYWIVGVKGGPPDMEIPAATETARGTVERATQAEVNTGTDTTRYVSPATLRSRNYAPYAMATGMYSTSNRSVGMGGGVTQTVTLPVGRFTQAPNITVIPIGSARLQAAITTGWTATSFTVGIDNHTAANVSVGTLWGFNWQAVQMTSTNANG